MKLFFLAKSNAFKQKRREETAVLVNLKKRIVEVKENKK